MPKTNDQNRTPSFVPFNLAARFVDVESDQPGYEGFVITCRQNLTNQERAAFERAYVDQTVTWGQEAAADAADVDRLRTQHADALAAGDVDAQSALNAKFTDLIERGNTRLARIKEAQLAAIAPFIRSWNVYTSNADPASDPIAIAPPSVTGAAAFEAIDGVMTDWLLSLVFVGYRTGRGVPATSAKGAAA